jgi:toxin YoeB
VSYHIIFTQKAAYDIAVLKKSNPACYNKVVKLLVELREHPETGTGKPEMLKYNYSGCWSRRIDRANRLVYNIDNEIITVIILSVLGHYE